MAAWTQERKDLVIQMYLDGNPTADNSIEICKQIAEDLEESPNGIRMILVQAGKYVKKDPGAVATAAASTSKSGEGTKRVGKEVSLAALAKAITDAGATLDQEIIDKLTGKSAVYFTTVISQVLASK